MIRGRSGSSADSSAPVDGGPQDRGGSRPRPPAGRWLFKGRDGLLAAYAGGPGGLLRWTEGGAHWDVRFVDYSSPAGHWFPRVVEVSRNGERQARFTTLSGDPRANVPDRLF